MGDSNVLPMISGTGLSFPTVLLICFLVCLLSFAAGFIVGRWYFRYRFTVTRYYAPAQEKLPTQENDTQTGPRPEWSRLSDALNNLPSDALIKSVFISSSIFQRPSLVRRVPGHPDTSTYRYHVFPRCKYIPVVRGANGLWTEKSFIRFKLCSSCERNIIRGYSPSQDNAVESEDEPLIESDSAQTHTSSMMRLRRSPDSNGNTVNPYRDWEPIFDSGSRSARDAFQELYVHELEHLAYEHIDTAANRARENLEQM